MSQLAHGILGFLDRMGGATLPVRRVWAWSMGQLLAPFYAAYQMVLEAQLQGWKRPQHIGIIMDGNRRFARFLNLGSVISGHELGAAKLEEVLNWCEEAEVRVVTVYMFSMENFNRDPSEVTGLMELFEKKFLELVSHPRIHRNQIRVQSLGNTEVLPDSVQQAIRHAEEATRHYTRRVLNLCVAYGGREEIINAFRSFLLNQERHGKNIEEICQDLAPEQIEPYLYTSHVPDPDLIIRTSGEVRLSGFLMWQSVYSEFYFCDTNWPAFRKIDFLRALREYHQRQRRFGR
ncbi:MAG: polyprenyl diphosphate synthase [SAR324 cluster bacterium]|nr:polyprenyl diphosphate synthase [SAR324 cluster bacterium]MCZ6532284.1 polyprenyl diphosphate synthase [SAR324 cluster bacterium]MCZ6629346.1 polyprenyl diphosphate synthase [SAR324 cluster bacterium]MCZ6645893.1 polyprenyl diphosphate synthase [SAR324 cluster bacterium]MCZ6841987.1 polyprenyl diphosphate synthase [SAR324 cluster bacterium]